MIFSAHGTALELLKCYKTSRVFKTEFGIVRGNLDACWCVVHIIRLNSVLFHTTICFCFFVLYIKSNYCNNLCNIKNRVWCKRMTFIEWTVNYLGITINYQFKNITNILLPNLTIFHSLNLFKMEMKTWYFFLFVYFNLNAIYFN